MAREKLNSLYWELGRPRKGSRRFLKDHLDLYASRHQVLFTNRPTAEILSRVRHMLKFNQFKERGEEGYWKGEKEEREMVMVRPGKNQRRRGEKGGASKASASASVAKPGRSRSAGEGGSGNPSSSSSDGFKMADGDLTMGERIIRRKLQETQKSLAGMDDGKQLSYEEWKKAREEESGPRGAGKDKAAKKAARHRPLPKTPAGPPEPAPTSTEPGAMYGSRMLSPFSSSLSNQPSTPGASFPRSSRGLSAPGGAFDENEETNPPFEGSSIGAQLLSENRTLPALSFKKAGVAGTGLSAGEEEAAKEPTASTYHPDYRAVKPRVPAHGLSDRLNSEKASDKFAAMTGPGSYDEGGSVGAQQLSTRKSAATATFSTQDRLKFMSSFAIG